MVVALGEVFSGVFCASDELWNDLHAAGEIEFDRFWRMPLDDEYGFQIHSSNADLQNVRSCCRGLYPADIYIFIVV